MKYSDMNPISQKRRREPLLRSESIYQNIYDTAPLAFVIWDPECRILAWNKRAESMFGWTQEEVLGSNFFDYIIPESARHQVDEIVKALRDGELTNGINENRTKSGEVILCEWHNSILYDDDGKVAGIISLGLDVTDRKRTEEMLQRSEKKYRLFVENAHDAIFVTQDGMVKFANPRTLEILGYSEKELSDIPFVNHVHAEERDMVLNRYTRRLKGEEVPNYYAFRAITKAGEELWGQINAVLISWEGKPAILNFVRDMTQEKRLQTQLIQAQKMQAIGTLAGGIAHDFNNLLSAIIGYTEMSLMEAPQDSDIPHKMEQVLQAGKRAKDLVNQILTFSRQHKQERKPFQIHAIAKEAIKFLRAFIPATIEFREKIQEDTGVIVADPSQIHQVIMNLCTNAAHAMKEGGGILEISLERVDLDDDSAGRYFEMSPGQYVRLIVSDTGCGMDNDTVKRIFDPYYTTKEQGDGTGLGLSVVHGIVKSHGGSIKVYSESEKGTTFHVYFPSIEADGDLEDRKSPVLPKGTEKILLVDDEEMVLEMTREMLEGLGYEVTSRSSSLEALEAFRADPTRFDLILTDQTMPKMTGEKLAQKIMDIRPNIPIILCTGFSATMTKEKARSMGIQAYLMKPILKKELAETIRAVLDEQRMKDWI